MVDIIPKKQESEQGIKNYVLAITAFFFVAVLVSTFIIGNTNASAEERLTNARSQIEQEPSEEQRRLEEDLLTTKYRLEDFIALASDKVDPLKVFDFIESNTHPEVFFAATNVEILSNTVGVEGRAATFPILEQQLDIFRDHEVVESVELVELDLANGSEDGVPFHISLTVSSGQLQ